MLEADIVGTIKKVSRRKKLPDGTLYQSISVEHTENLAKRFKVGGQHIEIKALENDIVPERYARNMKTFSIEDQAILLRSKVCVVGLGGLGGTVVEILARCGIGTLALIDGDSFEDSNLNRQFLSTHHLLAAPKVEAAAQRVRHINSSIVVQNYPEYLNRKNAKRLLKNSDVVVDCLDNVQTRFILEETSKKAKIPLVSAAVAGISGHITTIFPQDRGLTLIYGEPNRLPPKGAETALGCLSPAVTLLASLESAEVVKILLNRGATLRNRLLIVDLNDNTLAVLDLI
ncbi:MAG: HesA/MoeB/ThiF family protein [Pseudomonadota bacterium]